MKTSVNTATTRPKMVQYRTLPRGRLSWVWEIRVRVCAAMVSQASFVRRSSQR